MIQTLRLCIFLLALSAGQVFASITFFGGTDFRIQEVTDVSIGGINYTATFTHDVSYNDWVAANPYESPFMSNADTDAATAALRAAILSTNTDASGSTNTTFSYLVPQFVESNLVIGAADLIANENPLSYGLGAPAGSPLAGVAINIAPFAWVAFTVPEPSGFTVLASLVLAAVLCRFRSCKRSKGVRDRF